MAYFPNGISGEWFLDQCCECPMGSIEDFPCPILYVQDEWNYKQNDNEEVKNLLGCLVDQLDGCLMLKYIKLYKSEIGLSVPCTKCEADAIEALRLALKGEKK